MSHLIERYSAQAYALLRVVSGFLFLWHGTQKLFGYPLAAREGAPAYIVYLAGPLELLGGLLIMVGFFTRSAAFLCSGLMAFAYWLAHGHKAFLPLVNGGELAVLYCFLFLFISAYGPGIWSVDAVRNR